MCKAFSGWVEPNCKVTWKFGVDSHSDLWPLLGIKKQFDTADRAQMLAAKFEITPKNNNYLEPDEWIFTLDEEVHPAWFARKHNEAAFAAHKKWLAKLNKIVVHGPLFHPFQHEPPKKITTKHVALLKQWDSVRDSVRASVWASVGASVWASVGASVWDSVWASVRDSVGASVWASVGASVRASVWASVWDSVWASVRDSVWDSVWASVGASVRAYTGSRFRLPRKAWKYTEKIKTKGYPFQPAMDLWMLGLVPSFDGKTWRLHGGPKAAVLFEISAEKLKLGGE